MAVEKHGRRAVGKAFGGRGRAAALAAGAVVVALTAVSPALAVGDRAGSERSTVPAGTGAVQASAGTSSPSVGRAAYDLGDLAFAPGAPYKGRNEIAAVVRYPEGAGSEGLARGRHPLIVMQHGQWATCADRAAQNALVKARKALALAEEAGDEAEAARQRAVVDRMSERLWAWPCRAGIAPLPSSSGYDYLAESLARQGFVVVSMGANGINATSGGQADSVYRARADLINKHLDLWRQLDAGKGPLKGKLKDPETGRVSDAPFAGHLDLQRVGALGHSMGGGGVMQQVADGRHGDWPAGVKVKAALGLAPTATWDNEPVTKVPLAVLWGTCDQVNTGEYVKWNRKDNKAPLHGITLTGGNHNYFNTQWSPGSGQVAGEDDAIPGGQPGRCVAQDGTDQEHRGLDEATQRRIATGYTVAFFRRYLMGDTSADALLTGRKKLPDVPDVVRVEYVKPH
ncbi:alpha/beta hydrolase family protein [Streptomyces sp. PTD5-9]|uniref:alpha/beta hydrolase family protein n=1 Tax=Streptomyces sp. PTD5-9 TaxID=3120150 RepID=UPI003009D9A3